MIGDRRRVPDLAWTMGERAPDRQTETTNAISQTLHGSGDGGDGGGKEGGSAPGDPTDGGGQIPYHFLRANQCDPSAARVSASNALSTWHPEQTSLGRHVQKGRNQSGG